jgi:hypothetical protein
VIYTPQVTGSAQQRVPVLHVRPARAAVHGGQGNQSCALNFSADTDALPLLALLAGKDNPLRGTKIRDQLPYLCVTHGQQRDAELRPCCDMDLANRGAARAGCQRSASSSRPARSRSPIFVRSTFEGV